MNKHIFFQMWVPLRQSLIVRHTFYIEQARKRLLSQFDDIEKEAEKFAHDWLQQREQYFNPDQHDAGDFYESARDAGIEFYQLLSDIRDQTRLSVVAGMFHEWDKNLRKWLADESRHWHRDDEVAAKIWSVDFGKIADLLEHVGWNVRSEDFFNKIDACRLVVNVYKHGDGYSLNELKRKFPEYLASPLIGWSELFSNVDYMDHTDISVSNNQFEEFSESILEFWRGMPEMLDNKNENPVPGWLKNAILANHKDNSIRGK